MYSQEDISKYLNYSADDFLLDDFFIESIKHPNDYTDLFWSDFLKSNPSNAKEFLQAKNFIFTIGDSKSMNMAMSEKEQDDFFANIMKANDSYRKPRKAISKYILTATASIAACIAIIAVSYFFLKNSSLSDTEIKLLSYVKQSSDSIDFNSSSISLKLSEDRTITSNEYEQEYVYSSENIVISAEEIPKEEAAEFNQLIVPYGKRSRLTLSDGTKMWVNAGTSVTYPVEFGKKSREIYVLGEVYLDVTPDPERPFIVKTGNFDVRVLGTKFNVSSYKNEPESVVLVSGSVKVSLAGNRQTSVLKPNEIFKFENNNVSVEQADIELYTSWVNGIYVIRDEKMDTVMKRLSKYYGKNIKCSPAISKINCTGRLNLSDSFDSILSTLSSITTMKYTINGNDYEIY